MKKEWDLEQIHEEQPFLWLLASNIHRQLTLFEINYPDNYFKISALCL